MPKPNDWLEAERYELREVMPRIVELNRRGFIQFTAAGLLLTMFAESGEAQRGGVRPISARLLIGKDGRVTILTGKVEEGQGARTELGLAAAEELRLPVSSIDVVMADTDRTPDDGITAGSRTTPSTVPAVRQAAATARELLVTAAAEKWGVGRTEFHVRDGVAQSAAGRFGYAELAASEKHIQALQQAPGASGKLTEPTAWSVLGFSQTRLNARDIVTGEHQYPSDIRRPGMVYGCVLRPPSFGATLESVDVEAAKKSAGAVVVRDGEFVGCIAPSSFAARRGVQALAETARWNQKPQPSSQELFEHLKKTAKGEGRGPSAGDPARVLAAAAVKLGAEYHVAYVQHAPMEPRAAVAEWADGKLTVWTGTSNPFAVRTALSQAFGLEPAAVRVIVPDFGGGFGGKHTGEAALEAARIARAAKRPVWLRWTRAEEFSWAYSRPAAVISCEAALEGQQITAWRMTNINSGTAALETPYDTANRAVRFVEADSPLRQGSYRCLAGTANNFARESFVDELAARAGTDPLEFRLANLTNERIRGVLAAAAERFGWKKRWMEKRAGRGVGLACGTEKGSVVAACVEVELGSTGEAPRLVEICEAFECGPVLNPVGLRSQVEGCILMGLGAAIREEMTFEGGRVTSNAFSRYRVPRFADVPKMQVVLVERKDLEPAGAGETPIIAVAPAMANAVFHGCGKRVRGMPLRVPA